MQSGLALPVVFNIALLCRNSVINLFIIKILMLVQLYTSTGSDILVSYAYSLHLSLSIQRTFESVFNDSK